MTANWIAASSKIMDFHLKIVIIVLFWQLLKILTQELITNNLFKTIPNIKIKIRPVIMQVAQLKKISKTNQINSWILQTSFPISNTFQKCIYNILIGQSHSLLSIINKIILHSKLNKFKVLKMFTVIQYMKNKEMKNNLNIKQVLVKKTIIYKLFLTANLHWSNNSIKIFSKFPSLQKFQNSIQQIRIRIKKIKLNLKKMIKKWET